MSDSRLRRAGGRIYVAWHVQQTHIVLDEDGPWEVGLSIAVPPRRRSVVNDVNVGLGSCGVRRGWSVMWGRLSLRLVKETVAWG